MWQVQSENWERCSLSNTSFCECCLYNFRLKSFSKFSCTHIDINVYDLTIKCAKISTSSLYNGANDYVLISPFPPQSSPNLKAKYSVSQLKSFTEFSEVQQITQILL